MENSNEVPQKTKNRVAVWSSNPIPGHITRQNYNSKRDYHTKWSKSERERQISCAIAYMWNLEKGYKWTYLQNTNRVADVENICNSLPQGLKEERDKFGDGNWYMHTTIHKINNL